MNEGMDYYSIEELSQRLDVPVGTLRHWRINGRGPKAVKIGKHLRYYRDDVEAWEQEQGIVRLQVTAEAGQA